jgi:hypothetical protein
MRAAGLALIALGMLIIAARTAGDAAGVSCA